MTGASSSVGMMTEMRGRGSTAGTPDPYTVRATNPSSDPALGFREADDAASIRAMQGRRWFAVAAIGRDRPGIVADLSECVYASDCNLEDASMTMLGSEFSTLMLVSGVGADAQAKLGDAFRRLEWERRLTVFMRPLEGPAPTPGKASAPWLLEAEGIDKAGIVARISRCLADRGIQITDLRSRTIDGPEAGTPIYRLLIRLSLPEVVAAAPQSLERELHGIAEELRVEITLRPDA